MKYKILCINVYKNETDYKFNNKIKCEFTKLKNTVCCITFLDCHSVKNPYKISGFLISTKPFTLFCHFDCASV